MISQALIMKDNRILMVKQYVERGDIVWNYPGGSIEENESPEQACIREVREETGYEVEISRLLFKNSYKYTFIARITGGKLFLDLNNKANKDIVDVAWISIDEKDKFDSYTIPPLAVYRADIFNIN